MINRPLADRMRPNSLTDFFGQHHLVDKGQIVYQIINNQVLANLILWGPPGSGKTTLARLIAQQTNAEFIELSAVTATKADVLKIIKQAEINNKLHQPTILFLDEIHRFNKAQQDAFLPYLEKGTIYLIGATTENPSFEVINSLLSRCRVLKLEALTKDEIILILKTITKTEKINLQRLPLKSLDLIADLANGDARIAIGILELALQITTDTITEQTIQTVIQKKLTHYDKTGDNHYNVISAFIKSMRGGDANATLYYLARMLINGEDPKFIARRMIIFASEDVGLAASASLNLAVSTFQVVEMVGLPECRYALFHCATILAKTKKSRVVSDAMNKAYHIAEQYPDLAIPLQILNAPTKLMKDLGYGQDYLWQANFKPKTGFLPTEIADLDLFNS